MNLRYDLLKAIDPSLPHRIFSVPVLPIHYRAPTSLDVVGKYQIVK
jgi:hypothetical protein